MAMSVLLWFSFVAPSSEAPVYIEQKSNKPSKTGLIIINKKNVLLSAWYEFSNNITSHHQHWIAPNICWMPECFVGKPFEGILCNLLNGTWNEYRTYMWAFLLWFNRTEFHGPAHIVSWRTVRSVDLHLFIHSIMQDQTVCDCQPLGFHGMKRS